MSRLPYVAEIAALAKLAAGLALDWLSTGTGQTMVAGATGGAVRWGLGGRRTALSFGVAVATGCAFAQYLAPLALHLLASELGDVGAGAFATAAFLSGLCGMSAAKVLIAAVDAAANRMSDKDERSD